MPGTEGQSIENQPHTSTQLSASTRSRSRSRSSSTETIAGNVLYLFKTTFWRYFNGLKTVSYPLNLVVSPLTQV